MTSNSSDLVDHLNALCDIQSAWKRDRIIKLLQKILRNLLQHPNVPKYADLNRAKLIIKLKDSQPALSLLYAAGFVDSADGQRLQWHSTEANQKRLTNVNRALLAKAEHGHDDDKMRRQQIAQLMADGFSTEEAEAAIKMSIDDHAPAPSMFLDGGPVTA